MEPVTVELLETKIRENPFFQDLLFNWKERVSKDLTKNVRRYILRLENLNFNRRIDIGFIPPQKDGFGSSTITIGKALEYDCFNLRDYIRQYYETELSNNLFDFTEYPGNTEARVVAFVTYVVSLLRDYAMPILKAHEWPQVARDWHGHK